VWHIYLWPFCGIDYALAQSCALRLHERSRQDPGRPLVDYLTMCRAGRSVSFTELLKEGNLNSPFEPETLRRVAAHARDALGL
jgi:oligoendopeptidase F